MTAGESHGPELVAFVEGLPAGLEVSADAIAVDLARRQQGFGRGGRMKIETDRAHLVAGVRGGVTLGSPIALRIENRDFVNWKDRMGADPFSSPPEPMTRPRPGHADLAGALKYDRRDVRDVLERASARETAARVAVGALCRAFLATVGIDVFAHVVSIGTVVASVDTLDLASIKARARASEMSCADAKAEAAMRETIHRAAHDKDTLGGVVEVIATGAPAGLGSHVQWDRKLDGRLAQALMSIQAIKGVEIGFGFRAAEARGSATHDPIALVGADPTLRISRPTNRAGGIEGGISNGMPIVCRAAMKPIATLRDPLPSIDLATARPAVASTERSDVCAVPAASVVAEAMVLITLADAMLEKFGADSMTELQRNVDGYLEHLAKFFDVSRA